MTTQWRGFADTIASGRLTSQDVADEAFRTAEAAACLRDLMALCRSQNADLVAGLGDALPGESMNWRREWLETAELALEANCWASMDRLIGIMGDHQRALLKGAGREDLIACPRPQTEES